MSQENVELVRSIYGAWERGDFRSVGWAHPEIEYVVADGPAAGSWTGLAGMAEAMRDWLSVWQDWRVTADEYHDLDGERVLVPFHFSARGKASGVEVGRMWTKGATLFHVSGGKVTRLVQHLDRRRALEAAGLSEEAMSQANVELSQENVEALKRAGAAVKKNDPSILDALLDPDVVWEVTSGAAGIDLIGSYRGIDEVQDFFARWEKAWVEWDWEHEEMQAVDDHVVARMHLQGRGRHSGIETEGDVWQVWTFRKGKVVRYRDFERREEALEAAGLSE